jgi:purine-binding chemotaxis protein CheW
MAEITQYCTFWVAQLFLGIDVHAVQEVMRPLELTPVPLASNSVMGLINLRGQIVTAVDLRCLLGLPPRPADVEPMNVVMRTDDGAVSLVVDEIGDVIEVTADAFERVPDTLQGDARLLIKGVYKLNDQLLLILDGARVAHPEPTPAAA